MSTNADLKRHSDGGEAFPSGNVLSSKGGYNNFLSDSVISTRLTEKVILIIEDCDATRERLDIIFRGSFKVLLAATAAEGLKMLSEDIGVVLLDYVLPDKDGADVLKEIKMRYPSIPVIIMTGYGSEEICQKVFRVGAIDYIKKPFDRDEIRTKVELLVNLRNRALEHRCPVFLKPTPGRIENTGKEIPPHILNGIVRAKRYIDEHYIANVHISEIAREAGMNRTYFCYYFRLVTGFTFRDYLVAKRVATAKELLKNKNLQISEVAAQVGYSSKYFPEIFKKSSGITPKKFKK